MNSKNWQNICTLQKNSKKGKRREFMCILCRGTKMLCGKARCPVLLKYYYNLKTKSLIDSLNLNGASPPSVFVGRVNYPYVSLGPLIPPIHGDTSLLGLPELWIGKSIDDIVSFCSQLIRGKKIVNVFKINNCEKIIEITRELALSANPTEIEAEFLKKPRGGVVLDDSFQPFGPSAPLKKLTIENIKIDKRIEKIYNDTDLKAVDAVINLYKNGVFVSKIQRAFSIGAFGIEENRRLVPTRWSITAVDDIISKELVKKVKDFSQINEYRVYESIKLDNIWEVIMMPTSWMYELVEAWYPNTAWNPMGKQISIFSSHEKYGGRANYAEIGGCYYAARLAVSEYLTKKRRQAGVVILREAHPGYIMPVGVWNVRENVRNALKQRPKKFETLNNLLNYISTRLDIPIKTWIKNSKLLKDAIYQKRIDDFLGGKV